MIFSLFIDFPLFNAHRPTKPTLVSLLFPLLLCWLCVCVCVCVCICVLFAPFRLDDVNPYRSEQINWKKGGKERREEKKRRRRREKQLIRVPRRSTRVGSDSSKKQSKEAQFKRRAVNGRWQLERHSWRSIRRVGSARWNILYRGMIIITLTLRDHKRITEWNPVSNWIDKKKKREKEWYKVVKSFGLLLRERERETHSGV